MASRSRTIVSGCISSERGTEGVGEFHDACALLGNGD